MAIVSRRKPFKVGRSKVIAFPKEWTSLVDEVIIALDRVAIVIPKGLSKEELRKDVEKLLAEIERVS